MASSRILLRPSDIAAGDDLARRSSARLLLGLRNLWQPSLAMSHANIRVRRRRTSPKRRHRAASTRPFAQDPAQVHQSVHAAPRRDTPVQPEQISQQHRLFTGQSFPATDDHIAVCWIDFHHAASAPGLLASDQSGSAAAKWVEHNRPRKRAVANEIRKQPNGFHCRMIDRFARTVKFQHGRLLPVAAPQVRRSVAPTVENALMFVVTLGDVYCCARPKQADFILRLVVCSREAGTILQPYESLVDWKFRDVGSGEKSAKLSPGRSENIKRRTRMQHLRYS